MSTSRLIKFERLLQLAACLVVFGLAVEASPLFAQGCAMCKTALQGQNDSTVNAIKMGIVVMLLPPIAIVVGILLALRHRSQSDSGPTLPATRPAPIPQDIG